MLNMMYSDYAPVGKKLGVNRDEFYAGLARAFLMDKDAGKHKLAKYMDSIPESSEAVIFTTSGLTIFASLFP